MTQLSRPQADNSNNGYPDAGPYSRDQWAERLYAVYTGDENTAAQRLKRRGVVPTFDNMLVVTTAGGDITIGTGAGFVGGSFLFNDAAVTISPSHVARTDYVVMVENNTNAAYAVNLETPAPYATGVPAYSARLAILTANTGLGGLVQTSSYWMTQLFSYDIDVAGAVTNLTDLREFINVETVVGAVAAENTAIHDALVLGVEVNDGVGAAGLGVGIKFRLENSAGAAEDAGQLAVRYTDAAAGDETRLELRLKAGGADNLAAVINAPAAASVDGNARGAGAVDLQSWRAAVTDVASGDFSTIGGGQNNAASFAGGTVSGGRDNLAGGDDAAIGGGFNNVVGNNFATIGGGYGNTASNLNTTIAGGDTNVASGDHATITGGDTNTASGSCATVGGGLSNTASGDYAAVLGGDTNTASGDYAAVLGGDTNTAPGNYATVLGGLSNTATANYSLTAGRRAKSGANDGAFVWADSEDNDFTADNADQFKVRASGGVSLVQNSAGSSLPVLKLTQNDTNDTFIDFIGTSAADALKSISTMNTGAGAVDGPLSGANGWTFNCMVKVDVNGSPVWIPAYTPV